MLLCQAVSSSAQTPDVQATAVASSTVAAVQDSKPGLIPEPRPLTKLLDRFGGKFTPSGEVKDGFYVRTGMRMPGAGWIAAGPGYRTHVASQKLFLDMSGAVSWRQFSAAEVRLELPHLANDHLLLGTQVLGQDWTQIKYFGPGPDSLTANVSQYRMRAQDYDIYAIVRPGRTFDFRLRGGMLSRPRISKAIGWHLRSYPDTVTFLNDAVAPGLTAQPHFLHADTTLTIDTLDHPGHPGHGGLWQLAASTFHDRDLGRYSFNRVELVGIRFLPVVNDKWTLGARLTAIASQTSGANQVPFYFYPSLGGQSVLRGFDSDRFHDRNLVALNLESRWALMTHVDAAVFADLGEVAPRLRAFDTSHLQKVWGVGLRVHTVFNTIARLDVGHSRSNGWVMSFKMDDSFTLSTIKRWATVVPIVP